MENEVIRKVMAIVLEYCSKKDFCYLCPLDGSCPTIPQNWIIKEEGEGESEDEQ